MNNNGESATLSISNALQIFFEFVDGRRELDAEFPPKVRKAFSEIIAYYAPRLGSALQFDPSDRLYCPDFLFNYGWTQLWKFGQNITRNRTVAGVFMWLKRTLTRRQSEILKFYALERKLIFCLDACLNDDAGFAADFMDAELQNPKFEKFTDAQYRFNLLYSYYRTALARLNLRQQQVIKLSKLHAMFQHYRQDLIPGETASDDFVADENPACPSLIEIKKLLGFRSLDAVKAFKRRALKALVKELSRLFRKDINQAKGAMARREILAEWIERHCESRQALNL